MRKTLLKPLVVAPFVAGALVALSSPAALAQGRAEQGPQNANSICSYSGLNDDPSLPFPEDGRTQNYGQLVKKGVADPTDKTAEESPSATCNGHKLPWQLVTGSHSHGH